ncbi:helix-turn-helix domain-containing protein [Rhodococcus sp. NPDC058521]|uniref:helix-turn-helix domain-containing protein n=1 Tax=Rhodococcus sp. NPDC058521 TaxID=3346536 RepID=UPI003657205B
MSDSAPGSVAVLAYDGMTLFEIGIVVEVFGLSWSDVDQPWYDLTICTETAMAVRTLGGATLATPHGLSTLAGADTVVIPSVADPRARTSPELTEALQAAHARGARIVSICSGAFALADAGLLDGRRATTHWRYASLLRDRRPSIEVDPDPLYVDDGDILTSAGCAAGLDLCLHIVRTDLGGTVANQVARRMVVPPHRAGGQAQYIEAPMTNDPDDEALARTLEWVDRNLDKPLRVADLAREAGMSLRTFIRRFGAATGTSPNQWLTDRRIQRAVELLESTDASIEHISAATGFASPVTLRHHFTARTGTSPTAYRRTFRAAPA